MLEQVNLDFEKRSREDWEQDNGMAALRERVVMRGGGGGNGVGGGGVTDMKMETLCKKFLKIIIINIDYYDGPSTGFFKHRAMVSGPSSQQENSRIWLSSFYIKTF